MILLTRDAAIPVLRSVVVALITRTIRGIASELPLGREEGLPDECVASFDNLFTLAKEHCDPEPIGALDWARYHELDGALRFALGIA